MNHRPEQYYAKILLFGEYAVLFNSMGLSIPYTHFKGELSFIDENKYTDRHFARRSNAELQKFCAFIEEKELDSFIQLEALKKDVGKGLYFESSIPESYGLRQGVWQAAVNVFSVRIRFSWSEFGFRSLKFLFEVTPLDS